MQSPTQESLYYLFGTNADQQLYYHTIDLSQTGYQCEQGVVTDANQPIGGDYKYGRHKIVLEDPKYGYQLFTTRYIEDGQYTELVYFAVTEDGIQPATVLDTIHGFDSKVKLEQKLEYIHLNPMQEHWSLCKYPEDYRWSSAGYYFSGIDEFGILTHYQERV